VKPRSSLWTRLVRPRRNRFTPVCLSCGHQQAQTASSYPLPSLSPRKTHVVPSTTRCPQPSECEMQPGPIAPLQPGLGCKKQGWWFFQSRACLECTSSHEFATLCPPHVSVEACPQGEVHQKDMSHTHTHTARAHTQRNRTRQGRERHDKGNAGTDMARPNANTRTHLIIVQPLVVCAKILQLCRRRQG